MDGFAEFLRGYHYEARHKCRPLFRFGSHFLFGCILAGGILSIAFGGPAGKAPLGLSVILIIVGVYWFAIYPFGRRWTLQRKFAKHPDKDVEIEWQFTADKLASRSSLWDSEFSWQMLTKVVQAPDEVMLYPTDELCYFVPRHAFASGDEFDRFIELAKTKVQRFYDVA